MRHKCTEKYNTLCGDCDNAKGCTQYHSCYRKYENTITMVLKGKWFDLIESGKKNVEYRIVKPYWEKRLSKSLRRITFMRGYTSKKITRDIKYIKIINGIDTDLKYDGLVYAIGLYSGKMTWK